MRYIKQPDSYSCGPTAILNAMKWAGIDANGRDHLPYLQFSCRTIDLHEKEDHGTLDHDFDRVLRYVGSGVYRVRRKKRPTIEQIVKHLEKGDGVALAYHWSDGAQSGDHYCFIAGIENGLLVCINDHFPDAPAVTLRKPSTVKKWLKRTGDCPTAWFLRIGN